MHAETNLFTSFFKLGQKKRICSADCVAAIPRCSCKGERDEKIGGLLRFGIPDFKLEKWVVERRVNLLIAEGITFKTNIEVGVDLSISDLKNQFTAVLLATGATIPRDIDISGRNLKGIHFAMDFLTQQNKRVSELGFDKEDIFATDKNVIVIGGGDTGSDCIGTSNRQGISSSRWCCS